VKASTLSVVNRRINSTTLKCFSIQSSVPHYNLLWSKFLWFGVTGAQSR